MKSMRALIGFGMLFLVLIGTALFYASRQLSDDDADAIPVIHRGTIRGLVTIRDPNGFELTAEGCTGAGEWRAIESGQSVVVSDTATSTKRSEGMLAGGRSGRGDSCQFGFEAEAFTAETYLVTIGVNVTQCEVSDLRPYVGGLLMDIRIDESGLDCRNLD